MAAAAPELCPIITVSSSHFKSFSMNGSQMLSLAVTVERDQTTVIQCSYGHTNIGAHVIHKNRVNLTTRIWHILQKTGQI